MKLTCFSILIRCQEYPWWNVCNLRLRYRFLTLHVLLVYSVSYPLTNCINNFSCNLQHYQELIYSSSHLPEAVGMFLHHFFSDLQALPVYMDSKTQSSSPSSNFTLFTAYNFSNLNIVCAIYDVFDGLPNSFQLLRCCNLTRSEDIKLFFDRVYCFPKLRYLILGVNRLTSEVQQV